MPDFGDLPRPSLENIKTEGSHSEEQQTNILPEVIIDRMILYHGSGISGVSEFKEAEETTVGQGLYLTSELEAAKGYAKVRATKSPSAKPIVYEVELKDLRLADLRQSEAFPIFAQLLILKIEEALKNPNISHYVQGAMYETRDKIRKREYEGLKDLTWHHQDLTTIIIQEQGYDGLVTIEGGEGEEIGKHDTYLIFDPHKAKVLREILIKIY